MKKLLIAMIAILSLAILAGCDDEAPVTDTDADTPAQEEVVEEVPSGPVPFADVGMGLMDANGEYSLFTFEEGEGTCLDQGFPTNLVYTSDNVVKTADESYVEDMTMIDFMGNLRFDEVPLEGGPAACVIKATTGVTKVTLSCSVGEGDAAEEVCTGSFKLYAEK